MHEEALELYEKAASLGLFIAHLNKANVLELQGYMRLAKESFKSTLVLADAQVIPLDLKSLMLNRVYPHFISKSELLQFIIEFCPHQLKRLS